MRAYLNRNNLILAAVSAAILFYFSPVVLAVYLFILVAMMLIFHLGFANPTVKVANFISNTAVLVVTFLVIAVLLEAGLHLNPRLLTHDQEPDTLGEFSDFTSRGYLTEEVFKKPQGVFRILGLGDSFAIYAPNFNKNLNYHCLLQEKFAAAAGNKVEIVNAGMPAVGPGYYWQILQAYGDRIKPDLVMVGFFVGNDFRESQLFVNIGIFITEPKSLPQKILGYYHVSNTRLFQIIIRKYLWFREEQRLAKEAKAKGGPDDGCFSEETYLEIEKRRGWLFQKDNRAALERDWRQCAGLIAQMKQWCDSRKVHLVLLIFPDQFQVDADLRARVLEKYRIPAASLDLEYPNYLIVNFCRQNRIPCLDLLAPFQEQGKSQPLYVLRDSHWNEAGNRLAAAEIFKYLADQKLIRPIPYLPAAHP